ncbi:hypothetical protein D5086_010753 [Populus alba]|uniref:Uncharacterized protein n=1 Tax=Populus alba TaxID=43335 RepID=A0ACC4CBS6_POPAL
MDIELEATLNPGFALKVHDCSGDEVVSEISKGKLNGKIRKGMKLFESCNQNVSRNLLDHYPILLGLGFSSMGWKPFIIYFRTAAGGGGGGGGHIRCF